MKSQFKKLLIDIGPGKINSEAWDKRYKDFTIIGLEPGTKIYNDLKDVYPGMLLNVAVSDKNGKIKCWEHPDYGILLFHLAARQIKVFKKVKKKSIKLDSLDWKDFDEIHIWADIEGSELVMLKGAVKMLSSEKVKWIRLEIRKISPVSGWASGKQVYDFLDKYGFKANIPLNTIPKKKHKDVIFTRINK